MGAGAGSLVTRGALTLNADTWTNDAVIQAGRLTVNVNNLSQTADGPVTGVSQLQRQWCQLVQRGLDRQ